MTTMDLKTERQQTLIDACRQYRTINSSANNNDGVKFMAKKYWKIIALIIIALVPLESSRRYLSVSHIGMPDKKEQYLIGTHIGKILLNNAEVNGNFTVMFLFDKNNHYYANRIQGVIKQLKTQSSINVIYAVEEGVYDDEEGNLNQAIEYGIDNLSHKNSTLVIVGIGSVAYQRPSRKVARFIKNGGKIILSGKCGNNDPMVKLAKAGYLTVITELTGKNNNNKPLTISELKSRHQVING